MEAAGAIRIDGAEDKLAVLGADGPLEGVGVVGYDGWAFRRDGDCPFERDVRSCGGAAKPLKLALGAKCWRALCMDGHLHVRCMRVPMGGAMPSIPLW